MVKIDTEFSLSNAVTMNGLAGLITKIHNGPWLSQPRQNRFYVAYGTPVDGVSGEWCAASQVLPVGARSAGRFDAAFDIDDTVIVPSPMGGASITARCVGLHYGPLDKKAIEVAYLLTYDTPQTFGTGRWYTAKELKI